MPQLLHCVTHLYDLNCLNIVIYFAWLAKPSFWNICNSNIINLCCPKSFRNDVTYKMLCKGQRDESWRKCVWHNRVNTTGCGFDPWNLNVEMKYLIFSFLPPLNTQCLQNWKMQDSAWNLKKHCRCLLMSPYTTYTRFY